VENRDRIGAGLLKLPDHLFLEGLVVAVDDEHLRLAIRGLSPRASADVSFLLGQGGHELEGLAKRDERIDPFPDLAEVLSEFLGDVPGAANRRQDHRRRRRALQTSVSARGLS